MEWFFVARSKGGKEIFGSLFSMFIPVNGHQSYSAWIPFMAEIMEQALAVTKVHYLFFSRLRATTLLLRSRRQALSAVNK
jgi:hypothetical protein